MYKVGDSHFNQKTAVARFVTVCHRVSTCLLLSLCRQVFVDVTEFVADLSSSHLKSLRPTLSVANFVVDLCVHLGFN